MNSVNQQVLNDPSTMSHAKMPLSKIAGRMEYLARNVNHIRAH